jgi:hypothetical protein
MTFFRLKEGVDSWLIYGSDDGGDTVRNEVRSFDALMRRAAEDLHLAPHRVGKKMLALAADAEGHLQRNGNAVLLDLSRCFVPESPYNSKHLPSVHSSIFFRLLRPELLVHMKEHAAMPALSCDVFSGFSAQSKPEHARNGRRATQYMLKVRVPQLVAHLVQLVKRDSFDLECAIEYAVAAVTEHKQLGDIATPAVLSAKLRHSWHGASLKTQSRTTRDVASRFLMCVLKTCVPVHLRRLGREVLLNAAVTNPKWHSVFRNNYGDGLHSLDLAQKFHEFGINMRHCGVVRSHFNKATQKPLRDLLAVEMLRRTIKNRWRDRIRNVLVLGGSNSNKKKKKARSKKAATAVSTTETASVAAKNEDEEDDDAAVTDSGDKKKRKKNKKEKSKKKKKSSKKSSPASAIATTANGKEEKKCAAAAAAAKKAKAKAEARARSWLERRVLSWVRATFVEFLTPDGAKLSSTAEEAAESKRLGASLIADVRHRYGLTSKWSRAGVTRLLLSNLASTVEYVLRSIGCCKLYDKLASESKKLYWANKSTEVIQSEQKVAQFFKTETNARGNWHSDDTELQYFAAALRKVAITMQDFAWHIEPVVTGFSYIAAVEAQCLIDAVETRLLPHETDKAKQYLSRALGSAEGILATEPLNPKCVVICRGCTN